TSPDNISVLRRNITRIHYLNDFNRVSKITFWRGVLYNLKIFGDDRGEEEPGKRGKTKKTLKNRR
ncbi:MAG: hypothetical protein PHO60_06970, partial [Methanothrix sp.]|nr:hypothetical protein [Methanothrix sp.]